MSNLPTYHDGRREVCLGYVEALGAAVGKAVGSELKVFGQLISSPTTLNVYRGWEDAAMVHYPSIYHFGNLLGNNDYHELDANTRLAVIIKDTCILCSTEL